jgi:DNA-directed DNA polymerase III PolC
MISDLPADFTHLRTHSHFSLLGATPGVDELVGRAVAEGYRSLALTDTNVLYGAVAFRRACQKAGIQPIIGLTITLEIPPGEMYPDTIAPWAPLALLATGAAGYRSLCRLSSRLQTRPPGPNARPMLSWDELGQERNGLICLTGDRTGWLERFMRAGNTLAATRTLGRLGGIFGDACAIAVRPGLLTGRERGLGEALIGLGARFGLRAAAVQPIYCLDDEDQALLPVLAAISHNCPVGEVAPAMLPAFGDAGVELSWPDPPALAAAYAGYPDLPATTAEIAARCAQADALPSPPRPADIKPLAVDSDTSTLSAAAMAGLFRHFGSDAPAAVQERLAHEIRTIASVGQVNLFLIVAGIVRFTREQGIAVSTRGSVANSLVAYCLGISTVDPVAHELIFERFLNPARRNPPDIDLDFCSRRRDEVLDYVRDRYGVEHVAMVSTMTTMQPRSAVRETAKAHGLPPESLDQLMAALPRGWHPDPRRRSRQTLEEMAAAVGDPQQAAVLRIAFRLVGRPHHAGIHPGGLIITREPLTDHVPLELAAKGFLITQYTHEDIEAIGLPKVDLLGIRALTVLSDTADLVRRSRDPAFRLEDIPAGDPATGDLLSAAETVGVFQCESEGAQRTLRQLRARTLADLAVASAFFKPGPATGGMARAFVLRYRGEQTVSYLHPALEPILARTKGVLLFQEQVLRVVREIAGLSWEQADHIRRGMSKFKAREMEALAAEFVAGCCRGAPDGPGFSPEQAQQLWEQVVAFAGYGFNQGHATAYADVSYRSAYLKAYWPAEFLCARLADAGGFHHQAVYIAEARRLGIPVRPPHINVSGSRFTLSYEAGDEDRQARHPVLWMGLGQVRGLRRATVAAIIAERERRPFAGLDDLLRRVTLQAKETEALIRCGALDGLGAGRQAMLSQSDQAERAGSTRQLAFAFAQTADPPAESVRQQLEWERHELGLPVSDSPLAALGALPRHVSLRRLPLRAGQSITIHAFRLPGWTGGKSTFISDGDTYCLARLAKGHESRLHLRPVWEPMRLGGRWIVDEWDTSWFQIEEMEALDVQAES